MRQSTDPTGRWAFLAAVFACAACVSDAPGPSMTPAGRGGYLSAAERPDDRAVIPPPPADGSPEAAADLAAFRVTRALEGSPRWELASNDVALDYPAMIADFRCALGADIDPAAAPAAAALFARAIEDVGPLIGAGKDRYMRPRPFRVAEGALCTPVDEEFAASGSYPSGHATLGWTYALALAEMAPDRADEILDRGRVFAQSRVVCGVHYPTDVEAGRLVAEATFAVLEADADFQDDLAAARAEITAARASAPAPDAAQCAVEREAASRRPW